MEQLTIQDILGGYHWTEFATSRKWKDSIEENSKKGDFPKKTWERCCTLMPYFIEFTQKTPDELIEEAVSDPSVVKKRLRRFFNYLKDEKNQGHNPAITGSYGTIQGFYSHNDVIFAKTKPPMQQPAEVEIVDANYPMYIIKEKDVNGRKIKRKVLNREPLNTFRNFLSFRNQLILDGLISTGLSIGDLLKLDIDLVLDHPPQFERIFINNFRNKSGEILSNFFHTQLTLNLKKYRRLERLDAVHGEPLFASSIKERKAHFSKIYGHTPRLDEYHLLPKGTRVTTSTVSKAFQEAFYKTFKVRMPKGKQSPYRPARFRGVHEDAHIAAGVDSVIIDIFKGTVNRSGKPYPGKSREELEYFYEMAEPNLIIDYDVPEEIDELIEKMKEEANSTVTTMENSINEIRQEQRRMAKAQDKEREKNEKTIANLLKELKNQKNNE